MHSKASDGTFLQPEVIIMKENENSEIVFFGKITAGITHEMKNVLAIIKESSGLMEDLILLRPEDDFPHKESDAKRLDHH